MKESIRREGNEEDKIGENGIYVFKLIGNNT